LNKKLRELSRRRTALRQSKFCHRSYTTVGTSCTTSPQQIEVIELVGYSRQTCNNPRASSHDASTVVGVIHKLDRQRVLYMLRLCYAMVLCSFCLSVSVTNRSVSVTEIAKRIKLVLAWTLPSNYPTLHCKKSRVAPKLRVGLHPSGTSYRTLKISPRQVGHIVNKTRRRSSLLTTLTTIVASWLGARSFLHVSQS